LPDGATSERTRFQPRLAKAAADRHQPKVFPIAIGALAWVTASDDMHRVALCQPLDG
jgi:hypothetical protein